MYELIQGRTVPHGNVLQSHGLLFSDELLDTRRLVGHLETTELICNYSQRPHIALLIIPLLLVPHLRTSIQRRTRLRLGQVTVGYDLGDVHICQFVPRCSFEDIGGFDVSVDDVVLVQVLYS